MAIRALRAFMVTMPIVVIYWQNQGLSIRDIFVLQVIFSVAIVVLEIPSGYFADRFGRKGSLLLGVIFGTLGFLLYFLSTSFWGFALAEIVLAMSAAFLSGADSAFLYDTLLEHGVEDQHVKFEGQIISVARISEAAASLMSGLLVVVVSFKAIFLIQFLVMAVAIPIASTMVEPKVPFMFKQKKNIFEIMRFALYDNKRLLYLNLFSGFVTTATLLMVWFAQPYWMEIGVNVIYFGFLWAGLNVLVSLGALWAHKLEQKLSFRMLFAGFAFAPLLLYGVLSIGVGWLALMIIPLFWILRGLFQPIALDYVNREAESSVRATVVSVSQLFGRLSFAIFSPFLGWVADVWSLETAFAASALTIGILSLVSFILFSIVMQQGRSQEATT